MKHHQVLHAFIPLLIHKIALTEHLLTFMLLHICIAAKMNKNQFYRQAAPDMGEESNH
jgi:hypothetical protein